MKHKQPSLTVDVIVMDQDRILLVKRRNDPFKGCWALPGGFVEYGEEPHLSAIRETKEETGLDIVLIDKKQPFIYGRPERDPRGHTITLVFAGMVNNGSIPSAGDDAVEARFFRGDEIEGLSSAFDHRKIIGDVVGW